MPLVLTIFSRNLLKCKHYLAGYCLHDREIMLTKACAIEMHLSRRAIAETRLQQMPALKTDEIGGVAGALPQQHPLIFYPLGGKLARICDCPNLSRDRSPQKRDIIISDKNYLIIELGRILC